jgi:uncharacterized protein YjbJ (UPF0337 family)
MPGRKWHADEIQEDGMNSDQLSGKWKQVTGKVKEKWGKLTDSDLSVIEGRQDQLVGKVQERYGIAKEEAQKQVHAFVTALDEKAFDDRGTTTTKTTTETKTHRAGQN